MAVAARVSSPLPSCSRLPPSTRVGTPRPSPASAPSAAAPPSSPSAAFASSPIRTREPVAEPDALIVQDPTLLHQVDLFSGLGPEAYVLINSGRGFEELGLGEFAERFRPERMLTVPATEIARRCLGRPLPNAALLGGFAALTGRLRLDSVTAAIRERFPGVDGGAQRRRRRGVLRLRRERVARRWPMLRQTEGSAAVAEAVALCRPEVVCAYPISPQTHIVEGLSDLVRAGDLEPCEYITVESEFAALSVCIGASAAGARAYTATASQGLLYMAEALYNASGLGLPIVMTVANRAIGSPINIWNDHSDTMSQRDCGWIQLYAETNQEARRPAHPGLQDRGGALAAGDGLHGRLHPHPRPRAHRRAVPGGGRLLPSRLRAASGARPGGSGDDRRDGRARGLLRGQVPGPRQAAAGARPDPAGRGGVRRPPSTASPAASSAPTAPRMRRPSSSLSAPFSARSRTRSTSCATRGSASAPWRSNRSAPSRSRRSGRRSRAPSGWSCSRRRSRSASAGSSRPTCGWRSRGSSSTATR